MSAPRIGAQQAHHLTEMGDAILVCAYEEPEKFEANHLQGAISLQEFRSRADQLNRGRQIIFYCA